MSPFLPLRFQGQVLCSQFPLDRLWTLHCVETVLNLLEEMEHSTVKLETHDQDIQNRVKHRRLKAWEQVMISALLCVRLEVYLSPEIK